MKMNEVMNVKDEKGNFVFSPLPHAENYLEPFIGERTVQFHYGKHLKAYVDKVNALKGDYPVDVTIEKLISDNRAKGNGLFLNASQVFNHYFYFEQLNLDGTKEPMPKTKALIEGTFGSLDKLKSEMTDKGLALFGSGWIYLTKAEDGSLVLHSYTGTDTPVEENMLIALDVWEHAYYLDTQNDRKKYIENFFNALDWSVVEERVQ